MMNFNVLSALVKLLNESENGSHRQFLILRILAQVSEDSDIAVAINEGTNLIKYIIWKFAYVFVYKVSKVTSNISALLTKSVWEKFL